MWSLLSFTTIYLVLVDTSADLSVDDGGYRTVDATGDEVSADNMFFPFPMPIEQLNNVASLRRTAEWHKLTKDIPTERVKNDTSLTMKGSAGIGADIVGGYDSSYTVSAILPGATLDDVYILRRRLHLDSQPEFSASGRYSKQYEGAITVPCVLQLKINRSSTRVISSYGNDTFFYPNAMVRDPSGNFWFSDAGRHQVLRMNPGNTSPDITVGEQFTPGKGSTRLCAPTDVAVTSNHIYVADGRFNNRVVMYSMTGDYVAEFGNAPPPLTYPRPMRYIEKPQALAVDQGADRLYIADSGQSRVVMIKAGDVNETSFGRSIRYFEHDRMQPFPERIALHPQMPYVFALNGFSSYYFHQGFTFNTHNADFKGTWGPDHRGFVRPRALAVSPDGSTVYVVDANEESPEKIFIFKVGEYSRSRRNVKFTETKTKKGPTGSKYNRNSYIRRASTKGAIRPLLLENNRLYQSLLRSLYSRYSKNNTR